MRQSLSNKDEIQNSSYFSLMYLEANDNGVLSAESAVLNVYSPFHQADFARVLCGIDSNARLPSAGPSCNLDSVKVSRVELL